LTSTNINSNFNTNFNLNRGVDLHDCPSAVAQAILRCILSDFKRDLQASAGASAGVERARGAGGGGGAARRGGGGCSSSLISKRGEKEGGGLTIITGRGNRSGERGAVAVLPQQIRACLGDMGLEVTEVPNNPGCLVLTQKQLVKWAMRKEHDDGNDDDNEVVK
jgi:hypothetical protein